VFFSSCGATRQVSQTPSVSARVPIATYSASVRVQPDRGSSVSVSCQAGEQMLGGGFSSSDLFEYAAFNQASYPSSATNLDGHGCSRPILCAEGGGLLLASKASLRDPHRPRHGHRYCEDRLSTGYGAARWGLSKCTHDWSIWPRGQRVDEYIGWREHAGVCPLCCKPYARWPASHLGLQSALLIPRFCSTREQGGLSCRADSNRRGIWREELLDRGE
jgi:hypothetical protein